MTCPSQLRNCAEFLDWIRNCFSGEVLLSDDARQAWDRLRKLKQSQTVAKYLAYFRNVTLKIRGIHADQKC